MLPSEIPLEYIHRQRTHLLVSAHHDDEAARLLLEPSPAGEPIHAGRGAVLRVPFHDAHAILRPHRRGGWVRHLLRDAYLIANRPRAEFMVHCRIFALGAPVPEPIGVRWQRAGLLYRGAILTRCIDAPPLTQATADSSENRAAHRRAGEAVAALHAAGVVHADLNADNILVAADRAWIIDLDSARVVTAMTPYQRARNLLRLRRSYAKRAIPMAMFDAFLEGYGPVRFPLLPRAFHTFRQLLAGRPQ